MLFERFSSAAVQIIILARLEAGRSKFDEIDTPHLLLAFIDNDQGTGALAALDVYPAAEDAAAGDIRLQPHGELPDPFLKPEVAASLRSSLSKVGTRPEAQPDYGDMALSGRARLLFSAATELAQDRTVTPLHLLWAMLGPEQGEVADLLTKHGFNRELIEKEISTSSRS